MSVPLDLVSVRCFVAAAHTLNFRAAASRVHLSAAAFGQRIAALEEQLGQVLFVRTTRRVALTNAGERILPLASQLMAQSERFVAEARGSDAQPRYSLRIGTRYELGLSWLTPALDELEAALPERSLDLVFGDSEELIGRLQGHRIDAAVSSSRRMPPGSTYATLHRESYAFVAAPDRLAEHALESPDDAGAHTLIDINADLPLFRYFLDGEHSGETWNFRRVEQMGTIAAIRMRVLGALGVAVLPEYFIADDLRSGRLVEIVPRSGLRSDAFRLVWMRDNPNADRLERLVRDLRSIPLRG